MIGTVRSRLFFSVTTGAEKDEEGDEDESDDSRQTSPQNELQLSTAKDAPRRPHSGSQEWHKLLESVSSSKVVTWGQSAVSSLEKCWSK